MGIDINIRVIKRNTSIKNNRIEAFLYIIFDGLSKYFARIFPKNVKTAKNTIPTALLTSLSSFNFSSCISIKLLHQGTEK